jgi:hypothetical protein
MGRAHGVKNDNSAKFDSYYDAEEQDWRGVTCFV